MSDTEKLYAPRYWLTWLGIATFWCLTWLPFRAQIWLGSALGRFVMRFASRRRHITRVNLELCFPELPAAERERLLVRNFESMGIALFEMGMSWWSPDRRLEKLFTIEGMENLEQALAKGNGAILLSAHFTTMEIGGRLLAMRSPFQVL